MRRTFFAGFTATLFLVMLVQGGFAASGLINYQGRLTDKKGRPVTATVSVTFTFHDAEAGGNLLGGFSDTDQVTPDANGLYATLIGDDPDNLVPDSIFKSERVWLNVNINGEDLLPRKRLTSSGLAMTASSVMGGEVGRARFTAGTRIKAGDVVLLQEDGKIAPARYPGWNTVVACLPGAYYDFPDFACPIGPNRVLLAHPTAAQVAVVNEDKISLGNVVRFGGFDWMPYGGGQKLLGIAPIGEDRVLIGFPFYRSGPDGINTWNALSAVVASVDGTSLTLSAPSIDEDLKVYGGLSGASLGANQALLAAWTSEGDRPAKCVVVSITGEGAATSVVFGQPLELTASYQAPYVIECCPLSENPGKGLIFYYDTTNPGVLTAVVASVNGTGADATLSLGPKNVLQRYASLLPLSGNRVLACYGNTYDGTMRASMLTVSGNTVSSSALSIQGTGKAGSVTLMSSGKVCFVSGYEAFMAVIEGSSLVFGKPLRWADQARYPVPAGVESDRVVVVDRTVARLISAEDQGNYLTGLSTCIGVAESDALIGESCLVTIPGGITEQFSGLTPGARYYATETGLVKNPPGSGSCMFLGVALSPNKLQVWR